MIKKRAHVVGPIFPEGDVRLHAIFDAATNLYDLYLIAVDGTSSLVVADIADIFELEEAINWYGESKDMDAQELALRGFAAHYEQLMEGHL